MLDARFVTSEPDTVREALRRRRADPDAFQAVDRIVARAARRAEIVGERDDLRADRNRMSKEIGQLYKSGQAEAAEAAKAEVVRVNARVEVLEEELRMLEHELRADLLGLPNLLDDVVPEGDSDADNPVVKTWGEVPAFDFTPQAHVEVAERLGILDMERAAKLSGARFWVLSGAGARLERALISWFLDVHTQEHGYHELMVPLIVHPAILEGTGQLPKFGADMFRLAEPLNGDDAYLIPTGEVPFTNLHRDEILDHDALPVQYTGYTPCFRAEAGSAGRDVRGLLRVHQFHKVELVWLTTPEQSDAAHEALVSHAGTCLERLGLPYRRVLLCSGDTGFSAARCYDLEVWLPSQDTYREVSSCSNCRDFQARRMNLRYRPADVGGKKSKPRFCHTLNGSGLAVGRTLLAILENFQQADGSVVVPEVLRPYVGTDVLRPPTA